MFRYPDVCRGSGCKKASNVCLLSPVVEDPREKSIGDLVIIQQLNWKVPSQKLGFQSRDDRFTDRGIVQAHLTNRPVCLGKTNSRLINYFVVLAL